MELRARWQPVLVRAQVTVGPGIPELGKLAVMSVRGKRAISILGGACSFRSVTRRARGPKGDFASPPVVRGWACVCGRPAVREGMGLRDGLCGHIRVRTPCALPPSNCARHERA
eukprot:scaffold2782_cov328-Prasinococcus_capsulatus_cf.AAC.2